MSVVRYHLLLDISHWSVIRYGVSVSWVGQTRCLLLLNDVQFTGLKFSLICSNTFWCFDHSQIDAQRSFIIKGGKRRNNQKKESKKKANERGPNQRLLYYFAVYIVPNYRLNYQLLIPGTGREVMMKQMSSMKGSRRGEKVWTYLWLNSSIT